MAPLIGLETQFKATRGDFKNKYDAAVLFMHWKLMSLGFKTVGIIPEEEPERENFNDVSELLPDGWNADASGNYRIRYVRDNSPFNLAVIRSGKGKNSLVAALLNVEAETVQSFVVNVPEEVTEDYSDFKRCYKNAAALNERLETSLNVPTKAAKKEVPGAISHKPTRDECTAVIRHILEEQLPNAGFSDDDIRRLVNAICRPSGEGRVPGSSRPMMPRYPEPDLAIPPPRGLIDPLGGRPLGPAVGPIGRSDLDPIGIGGVPMGPLGPFAPVMPGGSGMLFDPFRGPGKRQPGVPGNLPPGAVPPGARFDPTGPSGPDDLFPGFHEPRGKGRGGKRGPPGSGPDPDHMSPPGYDDMFS
ncbi:unnamed protein product [Notodromas monacha]|uniref:Proteasome inhibitor PI31 subunit n=1 Tax=Notodromas monacha TaxID=399045 RepID=A0A7R9BL37_9CRUS|nr:unnamed protein product [Notodromas monacha]CAG0917469.1 unnamed protein product [Notodromas monacha]